MTVKSKLALFIYLFTFFSPKSCQHCDGKQDGCSNISNITAKTADSPITLRDDFSIFHAMPRSMVM